MKKIINRVLKLVGLNLVRAKRKSPKWQTLERYTPDDKVPPATSATVPLADYMGDAEWHNAPAPVPNTGKTHYVGCVPPHPEFDRQSTPCSGVSTPCCTESHEMTRAEHFDTAGGTTPEQNEARFDRPAIPQPNSDNKIGGPTS